MRQPFTLYLERDLVGFDSNRDGTLVDGSHQLLWGLLGHIIVRRNGGGMLGGLGCVTGSIATLGRSIIKRRRHIIIPCMGSLPQCQDLCWQ